MARVKIVTDSTSDIPSELLKKFDISVVPLKVLMGNETYLDGVNLTPERFYENLEKMDGLPTTSQPSPYEFETMYRRLYEKKGNEDLAVLSIHLSAALSGTVQSAMLAAEEVKKDFDVEVVDSKRASYAVGIIVVEIAKMAQSGASMEECKDRLSQLMEDTPVYFLVDSLEYLQKNGRIGKASALIGSLLKMKPVLSLTENGEVYPYQKVRGRKKALSVIRDALQERYKDKPVHIGVAHAGDVGTIDELLQHVRDVLNVQSEVVTTIGAVIGSHTGRGTVAVTVTGAE
ncbi:DegV family protein [Bacillus piscicola]|uniref:DegV family protein n=1 Tax=Bacillus piscicola TaxID=1632684 RepID=UPI001F09A445|nr:DegV family protein [Bacillus piscicola]